MGLLFFLFGIIMVKKVLPVLGPEGILETPETILVKLFQQCFASDYSQSNLYFGNVFSMQYALSLAPNDLKETINHIQVGMTRYLSNYFESVEVKVSEVDEESIGSKQTLQIDIVVVQEGKQYSLGTAFRQSLDGQLDYFINSLNG